MLKNIFHCPKCNKTEINMSVEQFKVLWTNPRDGWGRGIYHIECPQCNNNRSGYMKHCEEQEIEYVKYVIGMYQ